MASAITSYWSAYVTQNPSVTSDGVTYDLSSTLAVEDNSSNATISQILLSNRSIPSSVLSEVQENFNDTYDLFAREYLGSQQLTTSSSFSNGTTDANVISQWNSFIAGGDPFGFHAVGASQVATALSESSAEGLEVIYELMEKLIDLLSAIQESSVALSQGVQYHTRTQSAYTEFMATIDPSVGSGSTDDEKDADKSKKSQQIENLRSLRQAESDKSDQWNTSMSASNDASSGQSSLLTTVLKQMSSLISAIFR